MGYRLECRENSVPIDEVGWLGGRTNSDHSGEPDNAFMQMATNLSGDNGQAFVEEDVFTIPTCWMEVTMRARKMASMELVGLAGPLYSVSSCDGCHKRNGRGALSDVGENLNTWVVKVGDEMGCTIKYRGYYAAPKSTDSGEGTLSITEWIENDDGLRYPALAFSNEEPPLYSADCHNWWVLVY